MSIGGSPWVDNLLPSPSPYSLGAAQYFGYLAAVHRSPNQTLRSVPPGAPAPTTWTPWVQSGITAGLGSRGVLTATAMTYQVDLTETVRGNGALTGGPKIIRSEPTVPVKGRGKLTAAAHQHRDSALAGSGALSAVAAKAAHPQRVVKLSGSGILNAVASLPAPLAGKGALSAQLNVPMVLAGNGMLTATAVRVFSAAILAGHGVLSPDAAPSLTAAPAGRGALSAAISW